MITEYCEITDMEWTKVTINIPKETLNKLVDIGITSCLSINDIILSEIDKVVLNYEQSK